MVFRRFFLFSYFDALKVRHVVLLHAVVALICGMVYAIFFSVVLPLLVVYIVFFLGAVHLFFRYKTVQTVGYFFLGYAWAALQLHQAIVLAKNVTTETTVLVKGTVEDLPKNLGSFSSFRMVIDTTVPELPWLRRQCVRFIWYDAKYTSLVPMLRAQVHANARLQLLVRLTPVQLPSFDDFSERRQWVAGVSCMLRGIVKHSFAAHESASGSHVTRWREEMSGRISRAISSHDAAYIQALALGDTRGLNVSDWSILRHTGLVHLIAISGSHVHLVANTFAAVVWILWYLFPGCGRVLPRNDIYLAATVVGAIGYGCIVGFSLPTVRTIVMLILMAMLRLTRRNTPFTSVFAITLGIMACVDPCAIATAGFWLSFCAVGCLLWCFAGYRPSVVVQFFYAQYVVSIALLPISILFFQQFSLVGPVLNLFIIPWWSWTVIPLALIGVLLACFCHGAGDWCWRMAAMCFGWCWPLITRISYLPYVIWKADASCWSIVLAIMGAGWLLLPKGVQGKDLACVLFVPMLLSK